MSEADESEPPGQMTYGDAVAELEAIVADLDSGVIDVDTLGERFQRAIDIVEELDQRIMRTREKVDQLAPRLSALSSRRLADEPSATDPDS